MSCVSAFLVACISQGLWNLQQTSGLLPPQGHLGGAEHAQESAAGGLGPRTLMELQLSPSLFQAEGVSDIVEIQ